MKSKIEIHDRENNQESENHLNENRQKFMNQCLWIVKMFARGKKITVLKAANMGILSFPRRVMDLRMKGFKIVDKWLYAANGKKLYKEWFIPIAKRPTKAQILKKFQNHKNGKK